MRAIADVSVGEELDPLPRVVTREDIQGYAVASGDHNPLHRDDDVARDAGFPGIIAHGMFTLGHLVSCIAAWAGDTSAIATVHVQFRAPVFVGDTIVASGTVRAVDPDRRVATLDVAVTVDRDGVRESPIRRGEATVRLA